jgi:hypothetical protein
MNQADLLLAQWNTANSFLDALEGHEKEELFDFMMNLAIALAILGYSIDSSWQWQKANDDA